jgi:GNAT superfamily N-acetyltransferase
MTIREATADDVEALVLMGEEFLGSVYAGKIHASADALRRLSLNLIISPDAVIYVAEVHGVIVGMMGLMRYLHPMSGELTASEVMWWVNPDRRGSGVRLFRVGEAWAQASGATVIQMIAPSPDVERFYARVGYVPVERTYQRRIA